MRGSVLKVVVGSTTYYVDDPRVSEGLKATVSAVVEDPTPDGPVTRLLRRDRLNLDRARDRERFAEAAGIGPDDLNAVRDRVLDFLAPGYAATDQPPPEVDAATQGAARALLEAPDLLDRVEWAVRGLGHAGDRRLPLLIFLVFVSRLLRRPLNLELTGPSAAGKSFVVMLVARLFPPTAVYALNGMSERLLAYTDADLRHRILIVQEAAALHRDGVGAALLRSVAWEGNVAYEFVEKIAEGLKARRLEKPGPTGFITTTTGRVEPELQTRVLTAHVPDDEATSRQIVLALAERAAGAALDEPDPAPWLEAQRWLAEDGDREVVVPFAGELAWRYDVALVRSRRDFTQLLGLVGAVALLHQRQRRRDARGRIVADERDYRAAYHLASPIFGAIAAEGATPTIRATVQAVIDLVPDGKAAPATVNQVAAKLGVHKSVASRRAAAALKGGWLVDEEERKGKPKRLRPGDPLPAERPALPDPDEVFVDPSRNRATGQPPPGCAQDDGKNEGCADGCGNPGEHNRADPAVTPVAKRLQPPRNRGLGRTTGKTVGSTAAVARLRRDPSGSASSAGRRCRRAGPRCTARSTVGDRAPQTPASPMGRGRSSSYDRDRRRGGAAGEPAGARGDCHLGRGRSAGAGAAGVLDTTLRTAIGSHKAGLVVLLTGDPPTAAAPPAERVKLDCHDPWAGGGPGIDEQQLAETVRNALAAAPADRAGWRREIVHALVWAEAGRWRDPHLALDLAALRTLVPPGACLACDGPCSADGRRWCDGCAARHAAAMGGAA